MTVTIEIKQDVKDTVSLFRNFKEDVLGDIDIEMEDEKEKKRIAGDLEKMEKALAQLETTVAKNSKDIDEGPKSRFKDFMNALADKNSRINKALKHVGKGTEKAKKIARLYNKFSGFFGLPAVPTVLL